MVFIRYDLSHFSFFWLLYLGQVGHRLKCRRNRGTLRDKPEKRWRRERKQLPMSDTACVERNLKLNRSLPVRLRNGKVPSSPDHHRGTTLERKQKSILQKFTAANRCENNVTNEANVWSCSIGNCCCNVEKTYSFACPFWKVNDSLIGSLQRAIFCRFKSQHKGKWNR